MKKSGAESKMDIYMDRPARDRSNFTVPLVNVYVANGPSRPSDSHRPVRSIAAHDQLLHIGWRACYNIQSLLSEAGTQEVKAMPNIKSAIKRVKISKARTLRNASAKSALRTSLKRFEQAVRSQDMEAARLALRHATQSLDKAVTKGIVHRNHAARKKSRLMKRMNKAAV